jgi:hypothetical protein
MQGSRGLRGSYPATRANWQGDKNRKTEGLNFANPSTPACEATTTVLVSADALARLAAEVCRLSPDWQRPERFFERRSDIAHELRLLARDAGRAPVPPRVAVKPQPPPSWLVPQPCRCRHRRRRQPGPRQLMFAFSR